MDTPLDPRPHYARAADQLAALITSVRKAQLTDPTPCEAFDVGGLLSHIVGGTHRAAHIGEGGSSDAGVEAGTPGVPDDGWAAAYAVARARFTAAWAEDAKLDTVVSVPWGEMPGRIALAGWVMETVTHTWDLAQALGWRSGLDEEVGEFALGVARQALPADRRGDGVPFGPTRPAPEGAGVYDELAAWLGRAPLGRGPVRD